MNALNAWMTWILLILIRIAERVEAMAGLNTNPIPTDTEIELPVNLLETTFAVVTLPNVDGSLSVIEFLVAEYDTNSAQVIEGNDDEDADLFIVLPRAVADDLIDNKTREIAEYILAGLARMALLHSL